MTTFGEVVDQIHTLLHSSTGVQEQLTWLTSGCDASETTLAVADSTAISKGISELEDELIYVSVADSNSLVLAPFGRGFRGSTATSHAENAQVTFNPYFPKADIKKAINQAIEQLYPQLFQVKSTTFTFSGSVLTYELPADCDQVVKVLWETVGPSNYWETSYGWRFEPDSQETSGKAITLLDLPNQGRTVKVVYQAKFTEYASRSDTIAASGLSESMVDLLVYNVASKLVRFLDVARMQIATSENVSRAQVVSAGDAGKIANQFYAMYQQRLAEERSRLLQLNPPQLYYTR